MGKSELQSLPQFTENYNEKGVIDKVSYFCYPKKKLNSKQIQRYYSQYVKKWEKEQSRKYSKDNLVDDKEQSEDSKLSAFVRKRDGNRCRLIDKMTIYELMEWGVNHNGQGLILDAAHVFGKNTYPWMRFDSKNVVLLNRYSHFCLDRGKSPVNGKRITKEQQNEWWQRIVGKEDWEYLSNLSRGRN